MRNPKSTDIYFVLNPIIINSKLFCMSTLYYPSKNTFMIVCNLIVCAVAVASLTVIQSIDILEDKNTNVCNFSQYMWQPLLTLQTLAAFLSVLVFTRRLNKEISKLNSVLKNLKSTWNNTYFWSLLIVLNSIMLVVCYCMQYYVALWEIPKYLCVVSIYMEIGSTIPGIQFVSMLLCIRNYFKTLNLRTILINQSYEHHRILSQEVTNKNKTQVCCNKINSYLRLTSRTHTDLCDIAESINFSYSFVTLVTFTRFFILTIHVAYYIFTTFVLQEATCERVSKLSYYMWFFHQWMIILYFIYAAKSTADEVCINFI